MRKVAVIKKFDRNQWFYWTTEETWSSFIPRAVQFPSWQIAEIFLRMQKEWDGYYEIDECYTPEKTA